MRQGNAQERLTADEKHFRVEASDNPIGETQIARLAKDQEAIQAELHSYRALIPKETTDLNPDSEEYRAVILEGIRRLKRRQKKRAKRQRQRKS